MSDLLTRADVERIVTEARGQGARANLSGADLRAADLYGADLYGADLRGANLYGADLRGADLYGADLRGANLYGADLRGADLYGADLRGANLRGARHHLLIVDGLPSGYAVHTSTPDGWWLRVGCWAGTTDQLRTLIATDSDWPEAEGDGATAAAPPGGAAGNVHERYTLTRCVCA